MFERFGVEHPRWRLAGHGAVCCLIAARLVIHAVEASEPLRVLVVAVLGAAAGAAFAFLASRADRAFYRRDPGRAIYLASWLGASAAATGAVAGTLLWRADVSLFVPGMAFALGFFAVAAFRYPVNPR